LEELDNQEVNKVVPEQLPSVSSLQRLYRNLNNTVGDFKEDNISVSHNLVLMFVLHAMLSFPYEWLRLAEKEENFVEAMTAEATVFVSLVEAQKKALQDQENMVQEAE
jgi:hypothetical protein